MSASAEQELDLQKTVLEIRILVADISKRQQDIRYAPWVVFTTLLGGGAAFFAAGAGVLALMIKWLGP